MGSMGCRGQQLGFALAVPLHDALCRLQLRVQDWQVEPIAAGVRVNHPVAQSSHAVPPMPVPKQLHAPLLTSHARVAWLQLQRWHGDDCAAVMPK